MGKSKADGGELPFSLNDEVCDPESSLPGQAQQVLNSVIMLATKNRSFNNPGINSSK